MSTHSHKPNFGGAIPHSSVLLMASSHLQSPPYAAPVSMSPEHKTGTSRVSSFVQIIASNGAASVEPEWLFSLVAGDILELGVHCDLRPLEK